MPDRLIAPDFKKVDSITFVEAEKHLLSNQLPLYVINAGKQPVIRLEIIIHAGSFFETKPGVAYFTSKMLPEGSRQKSAKEISVQLDKVGAFLEINSGFDYVIVTLYTLGKHLSSILPILKEIVFEPSFPEDELETLKKIKIQNTKVNLEKTSYLASVNLRKNIFGAHHPYGNELTEDDIKAVMPEDLKAYHSQYFLNRWDLIVSGLVSQKEIEEINLNFGSHSPDTYIPANKSDISTNHGRIVLKKDSSLQSSIRVGKPLFTISHPDYHQVKVVNEILGGYFGSRLMKNIREEKGFTYGIQSNVISLKHEGYFMIGTDVKKEFTEQTLEEVYKEIRKIQRDPIPLHELETVRNYMTGSFLSDINTPFALADKFKSVYLNGLDYDHYQKSLRTINTISQEDILKIAQKYLQPDTMTEVIAGGI